MGFFDFQPPGHGSGGEKRERAVRPRSYMGTFGSYNGIYVNVEDEAPFCGTSGVFNFGRSEQYRANASYSGPVRGRLHQTFSKADHHSRRRCRIVDHSIFHCSQSCKC